MVSPDDVEELIEDSAIEELVKTVSASISDKNHLSRPNKINYNLIYKHSDSSVKCTPSLETERVKQIIVGGDWFYLNKTREIKKI